MRQAWLMIGCMAWMATVDSASYGQQPELAPVANAVGRFFGFGYSAGYHARVENRFGAHRYVPTHNVVPQPPRGFNAATSYDVTPHAWMGNALPYQAPIHALPYHSIPAEGGGSDVLGRVPAGSVPTPTAPPPVPAPPTPSWLKPYLKETVPPPYGEPFRGEISPDEASPSQALPSQASPSDRRGVYRSQLSISPADAVSTSSSPPQITQRPTVSILQQ